MASYHCRAKIITRAKGQSAVKSASYRSGERLRDERANRTYRYRKPDVVHTELIAPEGAPEWCYDRRLLWNRVERGETRDKSQVARELELSIPRELDPQQRIELVRTYIKEMFVAQGMVADISIHLRPASDGGTNPHAHAMLTMRRLDPSRKTGFARNKSREWDENPEVAEALRLAKEAFRMNETPELEERVKEINRQRNIFVWRRSWEEYANRALADAGASARVDHRSLRDQGIAREPQPHLGLARHISPHIERAYEFMRDRVSNFLAVLKRNELRRAFAPYERRDPKKMARDVASISAFADRFVDHWRQRPRQHATPTASPEVPRDR